MVNGLGRRRHWSRRSSHTIPSLPAASQRSEGELERIRGGNSYFWIQRTRREEGAAGWTLEYHSSAGEEIGAMENGISGRRHLFLGRLGRDHPSAGRLQSSFVVTPFRYRRRNSDRTSETQTMSRCCFPTDELTLPFTPAQRQPTRNASTITHDRNQQLTTLLR